VTYEDRSSPVTVTLNGLPDDGERGEHDNVAPDSEFVPDFLRGEVPEVELAQGGMRPDTLFGDRQANVLDGGPGEDFVDGNSGIDTLEGGRGPDLVEARDGDRDAVDCGRGGDLAIADRRDDIRACKWVDRGGKQRLAVSESALVRATPNTFRLRLPDAHRSYELTNALKVPIGSTIDPGAGEVRLTTARNNAGARQDISVSQGVFTVLQDAGRQAVTELRLAAGLRPCARAAKAHRAPTDTPLRRLVTRVDKRKRGRYRVRGRYSIGGAVGTAWVTEDRCDGTFTHVDNGVVRVHDLVRKKTVTLHAGDSYLAHAP
jgi:hypothetical protein